MEIIINEASFNAFNVRINEVIAFLKGADRMVKAIDRIMADALAEVKSRTPAHNPKDAHPSKGIAQKWELVKPDDYTWVIRHEWSSPLHPNYIILASLEDGAMPHPQPMLPQNARFLSWYDPELAAELRAKWGGAAWASDDDFVFFPAPHPGESDTITGIAAPGFAGVMHPGNRPYLMLHLTANTVETRMNLYIKSLAKQIEAIANRRAS